MRTIFSAVAVLFVTACDGTTSIIGHTSKAGKPSPQAISSENSAESARPAKAQNLETSGDPAAQAETKYLAYLKSIEALTDPHEKARALSTLRYAAQRAAAMAGGWTAK